MSTSFVHNINAQAQATDIPSVDSVLNAPEFNSLRKRYGRSLLATHVRQHLEVLRGLVRQSELSHDSLIMSELKDQIAGSLRASTQSALRSVFNLTGTVLHTNLGRALLPDEAVQAVVHALTTPMNLEFDLATGKRGDRDDLIEDLICELTGAEAATVVNNNAAAVLLMLNTLADQREAVVSRGELVEIGGAFRIPDIMKRAGTRLVEVGTTNRTHAHDYENAITPETAMLMKVHCSNYEVTGFTKSVDVAQVSEIARRHGLPTTVDLGSGTLVDMTPWGLPPEATVRDTIDQGADVVTFSGDKLLGGPQAGLLVGNVDLIKIIKKNPLKRALRVGKLTLAALEAVLQLYRSPEFLTERLTTLRLLTRAQDEIYKQTHELVVPIQRVLGGDYRVQAIPMFSQIGSGAMPVDLLPSYGLQIQYVGAGRSGRRLHGLQTSWRDLPRPVLGRVAEDAFWLDMRCLESTEQAEFISQLDRLRLQ